MCERDSAKAQIEIGGALVPVDSCIAPLVKALNAARMPTLASCCGHGDRSGRVVLRDGREIEVYPFSMDRAHQRWSDLVGCNEISKIG